MLICGYVKMCSKQAFTLYFCDPQKSADERAVLMYVWIRVCESTDTALPHAILRELCDIGSSVFRSPTEDRWKECANAARKVVRGAATRFTVVKVGEQESLAVVARAALQDIKGSSCRRCEGSLCDLRCDDHWLSGRSFRVCVCVCACVRVCLCVVV